MQITVAAGASAPNIFARLNTGIVGSNRTHGMDVRQRMYVSVILCLCCPV
jgi:hypothetical protein